MVTTGVPIGSEEVKLSVTVSPGMAKVLSTELSDVSNTVRSVGFVVSVIVVVDV